MGLVKCAHETMWNLCFWKGRLFILTDFIMNNSKEIKE